MAENRREHISAGQGGQDAFIFHVLALPGSRSLYSAETDYCQALSDVVIQQFNHKTKIPHYMVGIFYRKSHHFVLRLSVAGMDLDPFTDFRIFIGECAVGVIKKPVIPEQKPLIFCMKIAPQGGVKGFRMNPP